MACKPEASQSDRARSYQEYVEETLASSSHISDASQQATTTCTNPTGTSSFPREQQHLSAPRRTAASRYSTRSQKGSAKGMWMLRTLLVAVFLLPYVTALPSAVRGAAERSSRVEQGSAGDVSQSSRHAHQRWKSQVESRFADSTPQPGYLDRDRPASSLKGKRRDLDAQGVVGQTRHRRDEVFPTVVAVNSTLTTTTSSPGNGSDGTLTIVFETANGTETNVALTPPTKRWGQTATYLPAHNVILVVGGQTSLSGAITNDVYALDVSDMSPASMASNSSAQSWQRLSSDGLPAHAFAAASAVVDPVDGLEKLWIVGGIAQNCALDAPAYVWSAPIGNITAGKWSAVYTDNGVTPTRRRGAQAVALRSGNSTSIMISGGSFDNTTCASTSGVYQGVDMWTQTSSSSATSTSTGIETAHVGIDMTNTAYASIRSLALDPRMRGLSLTDYTTVTLPANGTCGSKILFLGGKDQSGSLAPMDRFWALDVATGDWEHWNATGLIPAPRLGHTSAVTPDGKIIIHGGYLQDPTHFTTNNDPISEVFVLDPHQSPARWDAAVWTAESVRPPSLAFHSAVMADNVMVVSFGKAGDGVSGMAGQSFVTAGGGGQVHYLDTATMGTSGGGMTWSTSTQGVAQARQAMANAAAAAAAPIAAPVTAPPAPAPVQQAPEAAPATMAPVETTPEAAAPAPAKASTDADNTTVSPNPASSSNSTPPPPPPSTSSNHTGAIAGSLLGAAAIAAAIGGIYAYRKRREAAAYNLGRAENAPDNSDADLARFHNGGSGDEEKGPYVSNLYLRPDDMHNVAATGAGAAAAGGWSARLKRAASTLTKSHSNSATLEGEDRYTAAPKPVITMRNGAPRSGQPKSDLPEDFITSLVDDESPFVISDSIGRGELLHPIDGGEKKLMMHPNTSLATVSSISSGGAAASHFSYPYLSGMHRGNSPMSSHNDTTQRVRVILGTPESCYDHIRMSPGDVVSPYHLPRNPHASPESLFLDFDPNQAHHEDDDLDTTVSVDGVSAAPEVTMVTSTPMFPWSTPVIAAPPPAKINASASMLRSKRTNLRVTNAC
ncbi:uncharacterized protein UTRI_02924 [Ustilago trichophora]|uniref:Galactose oxidase n=1 Tax=Ustilago trichophora TaxID=86804 RepID=A0A5C3ERH5_9BASI|nr:uncharacterized protein UTRI_02924 [Ustilago trichophora]